MNRLSAESSPYLRQHADNPVDWYPWGDEAFEAARRDDKPVLLSVGYSSCHWCHVMAHESFEDTETAQLMNDLYVNVKVDREERPDVDAIYMEAVQALTGHGGWPMTVFLTPDAQPFFGGTYYPKVGRPGAPSFNDVLERISEVWIEERARAQESAEQLTELLGRSARITGGQSITEIDLIDAAVDSLHAGYDSAWGGFGTAPKFPQTMSLDVLLRAHHRRNNPELLAMVENSLDAMASGGIYDHLGGGFSRYSTDTRWMVPHFEKMLYDNALFVRVYLHAWLVTGHARYLQVVDEVITYVLRDLRDPGGGFYSAEDADSEGVEGKFYAWTPEQINSVLGDDGPEFLNWYGVSDDGNFEGLNILWRPTRGDLERPASVELSRHRLFQAREMRIRPGLDDKVLTEWNGLMLGSLAEAALATSNHRWLGAALKNAEFLLENLRRNDGRWLRSWQPGSAGETTRPRVLAFATDLSALIDGFTRLSEASGERRWIDAATDTADQLLDLFWDPENGGVFTTGTDADELINRPKDITDNAVPSANSATALALVRLAALTDSARYRERATDILALLAPIAAEQPMAFGHLVAAADIVATESSEVVVPGPARELLEAIRLRYLPNTVIAWGDADDSALWSGKERGKAYVCRDYTCAAPATSPEELVAQLDHIAPSATAGR